MIFFTSPAAFSVKVTAIVDSPQVSICFRG
jgi:hypothetical protein